MKRKGSRNRVDSNRDIVRMKHERGERDADWEAAVSIFRPVCGECHHDMGGHFGDGADAGCWKPDCSCRGYRYPWEMTSV